MPLPTLEEDQMRKFIYEIAKFIAPSEPGKTVDLKGAYAISVEFSKNFALYIGHWPGNPQLHGCFVEKEITRKWWLLWTRTIVIMKPLTVYEFQRKWNSAAPYYTKADVLYHDQETQTFPSTGTIIPNNVRL